MKKGVLYIGLYLIVAFIMGLLASSKLFVYIMPLLIISFSLATVVAIIFSFTSNKKIKWNIPLWLWIVGSSLLTVFQVLFHEIEWIGHDEKGKTLGGYIKGFYGQDSLNVLRGLLFFMILFLIPTALFAFFSWKQKISKKQIKMAFVTMLILAPLCVIIEYIIPGIFENLSSMLGIGQNMKG